MSTLLKNFSNLTVVLFKAQFPSDLPSKKDLKELLDVKDINFYKRNGNHESDVKLLEKALSISRESIVFKQYRIYSSHVATDIIITKPDVSANIFANLKYSSVLIEGFNLSGLCLDDLELLIKRYETAISVHVQAMDWLGAAKSNKTKFLNEQIVDLTVTECDFEVIENFNKNYAMTAVNSTRVAISDWVDQYCWR